MIFVQTSGISTWLPDSLPVELWHENGLWAKWWRILRFCITSRSPSAWRAACGRHLVTRSQLFRGDFSRGVFAPFAQEQFGGLLLVPWSRWPDISFRLQRICKQLGQSQSEKYAARAKGRTCIEDTFLLISSFPCLLAVLATNLTPVSHHLQCWLWASWTITPQ